MLSLFIKFMIYISKKIFNFFINILLLFILIIIVAQYSATYYNNQNNKEKNITNYSNLVISDIYNPREDKILSDFDFINKNNITFGEVLFALNNAINDNNIKSIFLDLDYINFSTSQIEEMIPLLEEFKKEGKQIYAFGDNISNQEYRLAMYANTIAVTKSNSAQISLTGYSLSDYYYKDLLDRLDLKMEVIHIGSHKSFGENYYRNEMSDETKETYTRIFDTRLNSFIDEIAKQRKLDKNTVEYKLLNGNYAYLTPNEARDLSLIDKVSSYEDFADSIDLKDNNSIDIQKYAKNITKYNYANKIAIIYLDGNIEGSSNNSAELNINYNTFLDKIDKLKNIDGLKGVIIRINSGGGSALTSKKIYDAISNLDYPVYTSISGVAASGGYYISSASDKIFADKYSITGSIGVVSVIPKFGKTLEKFGAHPSNISKGKYTNVLNPLIELSNEDKQLYTSVLEKIYKEFKDDVLKKRTKLDENSLEEIAQGKVWLGSEALKNNLVDNNGGLFDTITAMQNDLNLGNVEIVNIYSSQNIEDIYKKLKNMVYTNPIDSILDNKNIKLFLEEKGKPLYFYPEFEF